MAKSQAPDNKDPYLIQSLGAIYSSFANKNIWVDDPSRRKVLKEAKQIIDIALSDPEIKQDSQIYYYRGLI